MFDVQYIEQLRDYIYSKTGKTYFKNIRDGREDILVTCPIHKEGQERHPSCGFAKVDKQEADAGTFHCFNCGFTGDTHTVLKELLGVKYDREEANRVLNIEEVEFETRLASKPVLFNFAEKVEYIDDKEWREYNNYYADYFKMRNITEETCDKYKLGYDIKRQDITFPIRDRTGKALGIGRRCVTEKRYEYPKGFVKPLYGIYELPQFLQYAHIWVVEGPFNLWSLYQYKKCGVALLGTGTQKQLEQLLTLNCYDYILALDGDAAGRKGITKIARFLMRHRKKVWVAWVYDGKDINDMTEEEFRTMQVSEYPKWKSYVDKKYAETDLLQEDIIE
ncbi:toprim domain-containing protein [uncultured Clostridium sp.]|uniref:toprim domain-containing protein n=1 Tax=uncultured Clostridium sp. TaxID=59620 RepID=UPI0026F127C2|nr:toprim domain-containing protein [uncultured Clostridium sp.]